MTAIISSSTKAAVKEQLEKLSSVLQYVSFEVVEKMLYSMKSLDLKKFQREFLMLTMFHAEEFQTKVNSLDIDDQIKHTMID